MRVMPWVLVLAALGVGCVEDFDPPSLVTKNRPLAARAEIAGDPGAAWAAPGDEVRLSWLMVDPAEPAPMTWGLLACPAILAPSGDRFCVAEPIGLALVTEPTTEAPSIDFAVPGADAFAVADRILVQGRICAHGTIAIDLEAMEARCDGAEAVSSRVSATVSVSLDGSDNRHPTIGPDALTLDGAPWAEAATEPPLGFCSATAGTAELPTLSLAALDPDAPIEIVFVPDPADREVFPLEAGGTDTEDLLVSHFVNEGELERLFSIVDDDNAEARVEWTPPGAADIPTGGLTVRFWLVLRDQRDGTDWTTRALCLLP